MIKYAQKNVLCFILPNIFSSVSHFVVAQLYQINAGSFTIEFSQNAFSKSLQTHLKSGIC